MEANEVIEGIEHFFRNILPKANFSVDWSEDSIMNAFLWAEFCEQVHLNYEKSSARSKLDELIHIIGYSFKSSNQILCFEDLKKSTNLLCEAFFENPSVENFLIESVLLKVKNDKSSFEIFKECPELDSMCIQILEALKSVKITNSERSIYHEVKAEIFLNVLKDATQSMTIEDEVEKYLSNALEKLCTSTDQMELLLQTLIIKLSEETSSEKEIQEFAINWLMYKIMSEENCALSKFIWKHPSKLRAISLNSSDFLNFYVHFLSKCSSSLICESLDGETIWTQSIQNRNILSFQDILSHFRCLLGMYDEVCEYTKRHLLDLLNSQPEILIWKEIFSRIT